MAGEFLQHCELCERRCKVDRIAGELGFCAAPATSAPSKFFVSFGEEAMLNPAYMLYFPYCNLRCAYCSNHEFIADDFHSGAPFFPQEIARKIDDAFAAKKIKVLQILGGEPTVSLYGALQVVGQLSSGVPVVWNSNFYHTLETFKILETFVDFYVADLKFGNDACASKLAAVPDYMAVVKRNLELVPAGRLLIRHLPLGGHWECCTLPVLEYLRDRFPDCSTAFHELMPDRAGVCKALTAAEKERLDQTIGDFKLKRLYSEYNLASPAAPAAGQFSGEILIRKDGSVVVQDVPEPVRDVLKTLLMGAYDESAK